MNFEKVKGHLSSFTPAVQSVDLDKPAKHLCTLRHLRFFADLQRNNFVLKTFNFAMRVLKRLLKLEIMARYGTFTRVDLQDADQTCIFSRFHTKCAHKNKYMHVSPAL